MSDISDGLGLVGRLHPALLHLPIGFITFLVVIEMAVYWPRFAEATTARPLLLLLSVIGTTISAACGWILSGTNGYATDALAWHKWSGTALVGMVAVLPVLLRWGAMGAYRAWLGLTLTLLLVTGHYGNALVRGEDYLFPQAWDSPPETDETLPRNGVKEKQPQPATFGLLVQPVLNKYCIGCHGAEKSRGKLRLDSGEFVLKGGESGAAIQRGSAAQSLLIKRLRLPKEADEHMPPAGTKQPGAKEIVLLELWINAGAPMQETGSQQTSLEAK